MQVAMYGDVNKKAPQIVVLTVHSSIRSPRPYVRPCWRGQERRRHESNNQEIESVSENTHQGIEPFMTSHTPKGPLISNTTLNSGHTWEGTNTLCRQLEHVVQEQQKDTTMPKPPNCMQEKSFGRQRYKSEMKGGNG